MGVRTTLALHDWHVSLGVLAATRDQTLLLPDAARYMIAAGLSLKEMSALRSSDASFHKIKVN